MGRIILITTEKKKIKKNILYGIHYENCMLLYSATRPSTLCQYFHSGNITYTYFFIIFFSMKFNLYTLRVQLRGLITTENCETFGDKRIILYREMSVFANLSFLISHHADQIIVQCSENENIHEICRFFIRKAPSITDCQWCHLCNSRSLNEHIPQSIN